MKKTILYLLLFCLLSPVMAQRGPGKEVDREKMEAARVAFITKRLNLSPQQAEKFWPKFNEHTAERRKLMRNINSLMKVDEASLTDEKAKSILEKKFQLEQDLLQKNRQFMLDITSIISQVQAFKLEEVNREFTRHIYRMQKNQRESTGLRSDRPHRGWGVDNIEIIDRKHISPVAL